MADAKITTIQMQHKMMKFMMIFMAFFFYKVAAGLCIYFICSSIWGMIERRLIPKNIAELEALRDAKTKAKKEKKKNTEPTGWLGKKMAGMHERWKHVLEEAQKQQQLQREERPAGEPKPNLPDRNKKKKRK